jgi:hypothetical protein
MRLDDEEQAILAGAFAIAIFPPVVPAKPGTHLSEARTAEEWFGPSPG